MSTVQSQEWEGVTTSFQPTVDIHFDNPSEQIATTRKAMVSTAKVEYCLAVDVLIEQRWSIMISQMHPSMISGGSGDENTCLGSRVLPMLDGSSGNSSDPRKRKGKRL